MKVHTEKITPAKAQGWLDHASPQQRTLSKAWVAILAKRIALGKWDAYSGTMITSCGVLVDGYHRCSAIVASGKTVDAVVLEYPRHSQWVDDTRRRSVADRNGTSKIIAAATRMAGRWVGINDPDMALMKFDRLADASGIHELPSCRPWACAGVHVGVMAAYSRDDGACERLKRIAKGDARGDGERRLLRIAAQGKLRSTGAEQADTSLEVFSALVGKRQSAEGLRSALNDSPLAAHYLGGEAAK